MCFTWAGEVIWIAVEGGDESVESILADADRDDGGRACFLVDRWDEDWSKLGWLQARGWATLLRADEEEAEHARDALTSKYTQYGRRARELSILRLEVEEWRGWEQAPA